MTWSVYQHWDPLKVCAVGRSYPPEFYSWITKPVVRSLFEKIAIETEEDYQNITKKLESFGVIVLRPDMYEQVHYLEGDDSKYLPPPMTPRDYTVMIGDVFYENTNGLPHWKSGWESIIEQVRSQSNVVKRAPIPMIIGSQVSRVGKDLYFGTDNYKQNQLIYQDFLDQEFRNTRNHVVNTGGHSDGTYCPVCPGLIVSLKDVPTYADTFPDWEVIYLPGQGWTGIQPFLKLKQKNKGKWWIPGFENNQDVIDFVEQWLGHWTGYIEETVFDVNMLIIDPKNVLVFSYNKTVFDAFDRYGITPHIVPFRHRYFWDGGIHCVTSDLHRDGTMQDYFPKRKNV
jgi:hypothetical protein